MAIPFSLRPELLRTLKEASVQIVYTDPGGIGYHCVYYMARLAAELLNGELVVLPPGRPTLVDKLCGILPFARILIQLAY
jgi:hypothetical protein